MPPVGFELTISAGKRPQNYILDRAATGTGGQTEMNFIFILILKCLQCFLLILCAT
jgi:hypothetical protein